MSGRRPRRRIKLNAHALWDRLSLLNMSQNDLADLAGLTSGYVSLLAGGRRCPSPDARRRLIEALGVTFLPEDFPARLDRFKEASGLTWDGLAGCLGVDPRQLQRWRAGTKPSGDGLFALLLLAARIPGGVPAMDTAALPEGLSGEAGRAQGSAGAFVEGTGGARRSDAFAGDGLAPG